MSRRKGKGYPQDFRLNAARLVVEGGYTYSNAVERLGVSTESLRRWIKAFRESGDLPSEETVTSSRVRELQREVSELRIENEILKKAAACFAKESEESTPGSSITGTHGL